MKNFKRVISAVIALALSASTLVAVSAAKFTDVDSTNYAEAIDVLSALDVVHGYEDGSFKPDGEITRAEAATMIVGALNMMGDAQASAGVSKFTDVNEKASWASGYVNVGVAQGFIHGMDDTTFAPQDNVTYAQMCVMLTFITGYAEYAAANGGYPTGYMTMAASAGINKNVALSAETPLKRGQVAQMLYNAVTAPVLGIAEYKIDGNSYEKLDGLKGREYKTLLSDKFDAFEVKATVDEVENGKVKFVANSVTTDYDDAANKADFFTYTTVLGTSTLSNVKGDIIVENGIDLTNAVQQQIKAILVNDANGKKHLIYAEDTNSVETKEIAVTGQYVSDMASKQIKFGTTKENFESTITIYVNGYQYPNSTTTYTGAAANTAIESILKNAVGTIKLAKVASTAKNYDTIFVDAYQVAQVRSVNYKDQKTTVKFTGNATNLGSYRAIEVTDNEVENGSVKLAVKLGEETIELKDLQENDIIAIKTKIAAPSDNTISYANGNYDIEVLVSRDTISGKLTEKDIEDDANKFVIEGTEYTAVDKVTMDSDLKLNTNYKVVYLDAFGRIAAYNDEEVEEVAKKYAIVAKIDDSDVVLVLPDGSKKTYEVKDNDVFPGTVKAVDSIVLPTGVTSTKLVGQASYNSVVEYTLKSGKISYMAYQTPTAFINTNAATKGEYRADVSRIGSIGINSSTSIIDADYTSYKNYAAMTVSQLSDGEKYAGVGFNKVSGTSIYQFVILTDSGYNYGASSRFAVSDTNAWTTGLDSDGDEVDQIKVLVNGEKATLNVAKALVSSAVPTRGTAFFYTTDTDGLVDSIRKVTVANIKSVGEFSLATVLGDYDTSKWGTTLVNGTDDIRLVKGVVVGVSANSVKIMETPWQDDDTTVDADGDGDKTNDRDSALADGPVDAGNYESLPLASDCLIYTYDPTIEEARNQLDAQGSLIASNFADWKITETSSAWAAGYSSSDIGNTVWYNTATPITASNSAAIAAARGIKASKAPSLEGNKTEESAYYAMALVVDGQVVEIYEILQ